MRVDMHSRKDHFKPDPVCAVYSIGESIAVKNSDVMGGNVVICMKNLVHNGNCNLCVRGAERMVCWVKGSFQPEQSLRESLRCVRWRRADIRERSTESLHSVRSQS